MAILFGEQDCGHSIRLFIAVKKVRNFEQFIGNYCSTKGLIEIVKNLFIRFR